MMLTRKENPLNQERAHTASIAPYGVLLVVVVAGLAFAAYHREPVVRRETWPYVRPPAVEDGPPEDDITLIVPATSRAQIAYRLHEIRRKAAALAPEGSLGLDAPPRPGSHSELDAMISSLIQDLEPEPEEGGRP